VRENARPHDDVHPAGSSALEGMAAVGGNQRGDEKGECGRGAWRAQVSGVEKLERRSSFARQPSLRSSWPSDRKKFLPILLDEIVRMGYARAFVASSNFESGQISVTAEINCPRQLHQAIFDISLVGDDPLVVSSTKGSPQCCPTPR